MGCWRALRDGLQNQRITHIVNLAGSANFFEGACLPLVLFAVRLWKCVAPPPPNLAHELLRRVQSTRPERSFAVCAPPPGSSERKRLRWLWLPKYQLTKHFSLFIFLFFERCRNPADVEGLLVVGCPRARARAAAAASASPVPCISFSVEASAGGSVSGHEV